VQITSVEVTPVELQVDRPVIIAGHPDIQSITAIFIRLITRQGQSAWGCTVAHAAMTGQEPAQVIKVCQEIAGRVPDMHPLNLELTLSELALLCFDCPPALCGFDMAFHDLLGLASGMPLYRLLGGYRNRIQTSITIPTSTLEESVEIALEEASRGFRILKIKGGFDPDLDVRRVKAIHRALPDHSLRLDADGGYTERQALDVALALEDVIEMLEQPTPASNLRSLREVSRLSRVPVMADQSVRDPASALEIAAGHCAKGLSVKLATCGGLRPARQMDAIARAARLVTNVSCLIEPGLLIAAGLSFALSSQNVEYGDLDGHLHLKDDPSRPGFVLEEGWLIANEVPGLGYSVNLG
jgi:L-alanine-DL-glutamate epimerase-like enolase superfamily enzyme